MDQRVLSVADVVALGKLVDLAQRNARVVRNVDGDLVRGIVRHLVVDKETAGFLAKGDDVRDAFLRVTGKGGFDYFWPVSELVEDIKRGLAAETDWS